jgi:hypothetical protein
MRLPVTLIIPALNEEQCIGPALRGLSRHGIEQSIVAARWGELGN